MSMADTLAHTLIPDSSNNNTFKKTTYNQKSSHYNNRKYDTRKTGELCKMFYNNLSSQV